MEEAVDIDDLISNLEKIEGFGNEMAQARAWLADDLPKDLASLRLSCGLSQTQLAKIVGLRQPNISAMESGIRKPDYETARKIAAALDVTTDEVYEAFALGKANT